MSSGLKGEVLGIGEEAIVQVGDSAGTAPGSAPAGFPRLDSVTVKFRSADRAVKVTIKFDPETIALPSIVGEVAFNHSLIPFPALAMPLNLTRLPPTVTDKSLSASARSRDAGASFNQSMEGSCKRSSFNRPLVSDGVLLSHRPRDSIIKSAAPRPGVSETRSSRHVPRRVTDRTNRAPLKI